MQIVTGHANPDFDSYAAMVAVTKLFPGTVGVFLGTQNPNVRAFHNLHQDFLKIVDLKGLDLSAVTRLYMVDTRDPDRIGELGVIARRPGVEVIVYDHHPASEDDIEAAEDRSMDVGASTSILVHELHARGVSLTPLESSLMLLGIHEDTGSLTYPGATPFDSQAVTFMMEAGADLEVVDQFLARSLDDRQRVLLDELIASSQLMHINGQHILVGWATADGYVDSASILTHHIIEDLGHRAVIAIIEMGERIQLVARSRIPELDVSAVMSRLGGGGHPQAASAALRKSPKEAVLKLVEEALAAEVKPPIVASDIMTTPVRVISPQDSMATAGSMMSTWGHGGLPVVQDDKLVGLVTRKDFDKAHRHTLDHAPVKGFMARDVITVPPDAPIPILQRYLATAGIGRVPVVLDGEIIGIVTRKDLLRGLHGEQYLDRKAPGIREKSIERFFESFNTLLPPDVVDLVKRIGELADDNGIRAYVVGGFVRDMLLGTRNLDIDVVVEGDAIVFAEAAAQRLGGRVKIHRRFGTAILVISKSLHIDITSARTEYYARPGALPTVERSSLRQDLFRRDFSINAMAVCLNPDSLGQIADPFGGLKDLERKSLRVLHTLSFIEDPTRVMRAARFEERYDFRLDPMSEDLARRAIEMQLLDEVSGARIREELLDIIDEEDPASIFARLQDIGVLQTVVHPGAKPQMVIESIRASSDAYDRIAPLFPRAPRRRLVLIAAMVTTAGRQPAERWLKHMRFGREYSEGALVAAERTPELLLKLRDGRKMSDSRLFRLLKSVPDPAMLVLWGSGDARVRERIEHYLIDLARIKPSITGDDLTALGLSPGPLYSAILAEAFDMRLDGHVTGRDQELANLERLIAKRHRGTAAARELE